MGQNGKTLCFLAPLLLSTVLFIEPVLGDRCGKERGEVAAVGSLVGSTHSQLKKAEPGPALELSSSGTEGAGPGLGSGSRLKSDIKSRECRKGDGVYRGGWWLWGRLRNHSVKWMEKSVTDCECICICKWFEWVSNDIIDAGLPAAMAKAACQLICLTIYVVSVQLK